MDCVKYSNSVGRYTEKPYVCLQRKSVLFRTTNGEALNFNGKIRSNDKMMIGNIN